MRATIEVIAHFAAAGILGMYFVDLREHKGWTFLGALWRLCLIIWLFAV